MSEKSAFRSSGSLTKAADRRRFIGKPENGICCAETMWI
jgi:hypothetical protein